MVSHTLVIAAMLSVSSLQHSECWYELFVACCTLTPTNKLRQVSGTYALHACMLGSSSEPMGYDPPKKGPYEDKKKC